MSTNKTKLDSIDSKTSSIQEGLERAERILDDLEVEESFWIKPYTDFDGPVRTRTTGEEEFHPGVDEAFLRLVENDEILNPGIISGRGLGYLIGQANRLGINQIDIAGEMGASYLMKDNLETDSLDFYADPKNLISEDEEEKEELYGFMSFLFERLAENDLQLMFGDNLSNVVGSACVEAYGINLPEDRFSVEDTVYPSFYDEPTSQDIQTDVKNLYGKFSEETEREVSDHFDFHGDLIRFDNSIESIRVLTEALAYNPLIPFGFRKEGEEITMFPRYRADPDFSYEDFEEFVESTFEEYNEDTEEELWFSTYHDYSFDFGKKGYENMKSRAAEQIIEESGLDKRIIPTNTGDKPTDVLEMEESIFFAQQGTEAEKYCEENDIPYVPVENTVESFAIQEKLATLY